MCDQKLAVVLHHRDDKGLITNNAFVKLLGEDKSFGLRCEKSKQVYLWGSNRGGLRVSMW